MAKKNKSTSTSRKLLLLGLIVLLFGVIGGGLYAARHFRNLERIAAQGPAGMEAFEEGDYEDARTKLVIYLRNHPDDVEALYTLSQAQRNIPSDDGRHLVEAISTLRRVRELEPDRPGLTDELLELYRRARFDSELMALTEEILREQPDHQEALGARVAVLTRTRRFDEALEVARQIVTYDPTHVRGHLDVLQLMRRRGDTGADLVTYATDLDEEAMGASRRAFLVGAAHRLADQRDRARSFYELAAEDPPADAAMVAALAVELDRLGEIQLANEMVQQSLAKDESDDDLRQIHVGRLLQTGQFQAAREALASVDAASPDADTGLLVYKAITLIELRELDALDAIVANLADRRDDETARAWAPVLRSGRGTSGTRREQAEQVAAATRRARERLPQDAFLALLQGRAYMIVGEYNLALRALGDAAELATASPRPLAMIAEIYNRQSRYLDAARTAREALIRWQRDVDAGVQLVLALANLEEGRPDGDVLLQLTSAVQAMRPGEGRTLPLQVQLLAENGEEELAREILDAVVTAEQAADEQLLLRLATAARPFAPEAANRLLERSREAHGFTPRMAFMQAAMVREEQGDEAGLRVFADAEPPEEPAETHRQWQFYRAHYLEATHPERAADAWRTLFESGAESQEMLQAILEARSVQDDRAFRRQVIQGLREATGEESSVWRMAMARWWLGDTENPERSAAEAALLLNHVTRNTPENAEAYTLLASALSRMGNQRGMVESLRRALDLRPDMPDAALTLAAILQDRGEFQEAGEHLRRVTQRPLNETQRRRAAQLYVARGESEQAIQLLQQSADPEAQAEAHGDLMLAQLYVQRSELERGDEILSSLLQDPEQANQPRTLRFAADFYAAQGRDEEAGAMLDRLAALEDIDASSRHQLLAGHHAAHGSVDEARRHFEAAVAADPSSASAWRAYLYWTIQQGEVTEAGQIVRAASQGVPDDAAIRAVASLTNYEAAIEAPLLRPLLASLLAEREAYRDVARDVLREAIPIQRGEDEGENFAIELERRANLHPRFMALQIFAAQVLSGLGNHDSAVRVATRAVESFPADAQPLAVAGRVLLAAGRWDEAISFARRWRERAPQQAMRADAVIARAELNLNRHRQVVDRLAPVIDRAVASPLEHGEIIETYARALVAVGDIDRAEQLLRPMTEEVAGVRNLMRSLAQSEVEQADVVERWLELVDAATPADRVNERIATALAWFRAGTRLEREVFHRACEQLVAELVESPDATPAVFMLYGELAQQRDDWEAAEHGYRQVLEQQPENAVAMNNLALVLLQQDRQLLHAVDLARSATERLPNLPEVHDTLAQVLLKVGEYEEAVEASQAALDLDPSSLRWQVELLWTLAQAGRTDEAAAGFEAIEPQITDRDALPEEVRDRVAQLEQLLAPAAATTE